MNKLRLSLASIGLLGCTSVTFTRAAPALPPREVTCDFAMLTTLPPQPFRELGTVDFDCRGLSCTDNLTEFKAAIGPTVCKAGGNAAYVLLTVYGYYVKATVLHVPPRQSPS